MTLVDGRAVFGRQVEGVEDILHAGGQPVQRAADRTPVEFAGGAEHRVALDAGPGLHGRFARIDVFEQAADQGLCRQFAT